tara:strand:- start:303 stop:644 length:342 start_codon:yes stop_codon:yes gene_type:complete
MINEVDKATVLSLEDIKENYKTTVFVGQTRSRFNDDVFQEALQLALENPNKYIRFFEYSHEELLMVKKEDNALKSFCKGYFAKRKMKTFKVQSIRQGNKVTGFLVNIKLDEEE